MFWKTNKKFFELSKRTRTLIRKCSTFSLGINPQTVRLTFSVHCKPKPKLNKGSTDNGLTLKEFPDLTKNAKELFPRYLVGRFSKYYLSFCVSHYFHQWNIFLGWKLLSTVITANVPRSSHYLLNTHHIYNSLIWRFLLVKIAFLSLFREGLNKKIKNIWWNFPQKGGPPVPPKLFILTKK